MNTKKLIARFMFMLTFTGTILKIPLRIQAEVPGQPVQAPAGQTCFQAPLPDIRTEFIRAESAAATDSLFRASLKASKPAPYLLSESEWADSGSDYYFSLLDTKEKNLYLSLKQAADRYMNNTDNFQMTKVMRNGNEVRTYILPMVSYQGLTTEQMKKVFYCFMFENPQYYFMRNSVIYSEKSQTMTIGLYEMFANGSTREDYTAEFARQIRIWEEQIAEAGTTVEKERLIHQIVCDYVSYNENAQEDDPEDKIMSQSCISAVLFDRSTVCMGYAQLFSLLCNRAGIQCVTVTSASHAWNKVRMGSIWYNTDCTWNDSRGDQKYLNVTDEQLQAEDTKLAEHTLSPEWEHLAPPCVAGFDPQMADGEDIGANILSPVKPENVVSKSREKGRIAIEIEPVENGDGYCIQYSLNTSMEASRTKESETGSCVISNLKSGKVYYIRARAFTLDSNGNRLYGAYSKKQKITVK